MSAALMAAEIDGGDRSKSAKRVGHIVTVKTDGFEYEGRLYKTLSPIVREITGTR